MENGQRQEGLSPSLLPADREGEHNFAHHPPDESFLHAGTELLELRHSSTPLPGGPGGVNVVGPPNVQVEWENTPEERDRPGNQIRCLPDGLGSSLSGSDNRRSVDGGRNLDACKLPRKPLAVRFALQSFTKSREVSLYG